MSTTPRTDSFLKRPDTAWDAMWIEHARTLERELTAEREKVRVLREALENLIDEQNGAPLCTREEEWKQAMNEAEAALAATAQEESP